MENTKKLILPLLLAGTLCPVFAQSDAILAGAGYSSPAPFQVAPGQVVTLFFRGVPPAADGQFRSGHADTSSLPVTLAGLSVRITQGPAVSLQAPILAVRQENECGLSGGAGAACLLTSIKVQIPFELSADVTISRTGQIAYSSLAQVSIDVDGRSGRLFPLQPVPDNAHVLTNCDLSWDNKPDSICNRQVYHADGTPADENAPAKGGETVTVYVYGLGQTSPAAITGAASPSGTAITGVQGYPRVDAPFQRNFLNALSSAPRTYTAPPADAVILPVTAAGLVPGQIGLYQLSIPLPLPLSSFYPCGDDVHSNATLSIRTSQGSEGIALCVQP